MSPTKPSAHRALARDHKGVALVRATEQHHGIH